jgi:hypothetical protein
MMREGSFVICLQTFSRLLNYEVVKLDLSILHLQLLQDVLLLSTHLKWQNGAWSIPYAFPLSSSNPLIKLIMEALKY